MTDDALGVCTPISHRNVLSNFLPVTLIHIHLRFRATSVTVTRTPLSATAVQQEKSEKQMKATAAATASAVALCSHGISAFAPQPSLSAASRFSRPLSPGRGASSCSSARGVRPRVSMAVALPSAISVESRTSSSPLTIDMEGVQLSGLNGLALQPKTFPTKREVINVIPKHCFVKDTARSMKYAVMSCAITLSMGGLAAAFLPLEV